MNLDLFHRITAHWQGPIQDFLNGGGAKDYEHAAHIPSTKREVPYFRDPGPSLLSGTEGNNEKENFIVIFFNWIGLGNHKGSEPSGVKMGRM